ncbi:hypothetical protein ABT404_44655 [Streptomyces hyaluromycini]|uniref:Secreted protein n=1 Tax=Streptomyces hyaluromycini TaxID=1377993 RepID=A0ABV1XBT0_9ACTN
MRSTRAMRGLLVAGAATVSLVLTAQTAMAATTITLAGRGKATVNTGGLHISVCDTHADNWGVRLHYVLQNGTSGTAGDGDGSGGTCGTRDFSSSVAKIQLCAGVSGADTSCYPAEGYLARDSW